MRHDQVLLLDESFTTCHPTGSRVICNPPVQDTDEDWVVLANGEEFASRLLEAGFEDCFQENQTEDEDLPDWVEQGQTFDPYGGSGFRAFRLGDLNLIVTQNVLFYTAFVESTELAKRLVLNDKAQRVALFDYVMKKAGVK